MVVNIKSWCERMNLQNYTVRDDGIVDVDGNVNISHKSLEVIPIQFGHVSGNFSCQNNKLITLKGCPITIDGNFSCASNEIFLLNHSPKEVGGHYFCNNNKLISLKGIPKKINGTFMCAQNSLKTLKYGPTEIDGSFNCCYNKLSSLEHGPIIVNGDYSCDFNRLTSLEGLAKKISKTFYCGNNKLTSLVLNIDVMGVSCNDNPMYVVFKLFKNYNGYKESLDYGYWRDGKINRRRFKMACDNAGISMPNKISGYKFI